MPSERAKALTAKADRALAVLLERADAMQDAPLGAAYQFRRVADVLAHLHAWHLIFDGWVAQERAGAVPAFPAEGYSWADLDRLNEALFQAHRERTYESLRAMLVSSHRSMEHLLGTFSEDDLVSPDAHPWLGGQTLGDVADECLGEHYEWALRTLDATSVR